MIWLDLETTGKEPSKDRIISFALLDTGTGEIYSSLVNPLRPIPPEVTELTGISDDDVKDAPQFPDVAPAIVEFVEGRTLAGYNVLHFDWPLLAMELERIGIFPKWGPVIDTLPIFRHHRPSSLADAFKFYTGEEMTDAHDAEADIIAAQRVFEEQLKRDPTLAGLTDEQLADFCSHDRRPVDPAGHLRLVGGEVVFNHAGQRDVPVHKNPKYANWMLGKDFPETTKRIIEEILKRSQPQRRLFDQS